MGQAAIFNGDYIKLLKDQLKLNETASILTGTDDPRQVAKNAPRGSLYLRTSDGTFFVKQDAGSSTNWDFFVNNDEFDLSLISSPNLTIRNGFILLDDGRELTTYNGSSYNVDITVNLTTILGTTPAISTTYYLYVDLTTLTSSPTTLPGGRQVYGVAQANLALSTTSPALRNARRYLPLGIVNTSAGSAWTTPVFTLAKRRHDSRITEPSSVIFTQDKTQVRSVGDTGQIRLGHVLSANSFSFSSLSGVAAFFSLASNGTDGSVNAKNLTNAGSVVFTGTGLFGTDTAATFSGTGKIFTSTDAFFNPGNNKSIAVGAWLSMSSWAPGAGVPFEVFRVGTSGGADRGFNLQVNVNGDIVATGTNTAGATTWTVTVPNPGFAAGSWHHLTWRYNFAATRLSIYVDGEEAAFTSAMTNQRAVTSASLVVGSTGTPTPTVKMRELFFVANGLVTQNDIRKLQSYRLDHNTGAASANQVWTANYYRSDSKIINQIDQSSWVVDKSSTDSVYLDFSDIDSTEFVSFKLQETDFTAFIVPKTPPFDTGYVSTLNGINLNHPDASNFVANHSLAATPTYYSIQYEATTGEFDALAVDNYLSVTSTQLVGDLSSLTIGPSNRIRIFANTGIDPTAAVGVATATAAGVLSATTQTIGGRKTFSSPIKTPVAAVTTTYLAISGDDLFADSSGGAFTITLPASPSLGDKVVIRDAVGTFASNPVTVGRNGSNIQGAASNLTLNVNEQMVTLVYYNASAGWRVFQ